MTDNATPTPPQGGAPETVTVGVSYTRCAIVRNAAGEIMGEIHVPEGIGSWLILRLRFKHIFPSAPWLFLFGRQILQATSALRWISYATAVAILLHLFQNVTI